MQSFNKRLLDEIKRKNSHLCVGLDINPEGLNNYNSTLEDLKAHTFKVIDATRELAVAFKPNLAFFERWGSKGFKWLEETMDYLGPESITIGDAKRGDIGNTAKQYAMSLFDHFGFDSVTLSPYLGFDSIDSFIMQPNKGIFLLCRTSNPSAKDIQDLKLSSDELLFEQIAKLAVKWNKNDNIGLVVGATKPEEIERVRKIANNLPMLIPGIGAQGGDLKKSMKYGNKNGVALINISRGISFAGDLSTSAIKDSAKQFLQKMREYN